MVAVPVPVVTTLSGVRVNVQVPVAGNPLRTTLPVLTQSGLVIVPTTGAEILGMFAPIVTETEASDTKPTESVTVNVYTPGRSPDRVAAAPVPGSFMSSGVDLINQPPFDGNPEKVTLPVLTVPLGCLTVLITGVLGFMFVAGAACNVCKALKIFSRPPVVH